MKMIPIAHVPRRVAALTGLPGPSPRVVYDRALRGAFPAEFISGRWFVPEQDIPKVAAALGMTVLSSEVAEFGPHPRRAVGDAAHTRCTDHPIA